MAHVLATIDVGGSFQQFEFDCDVSLSSVNEPLVDELCDAVRCAWNSRKEKRLHIHKSPNRIVNVCAEDGVCSFEFGYDISRDSITGSVLG